jgi:hypothetical protein
MVVFHITSKDCIVDASIAFKRIQQLVSQLEFLLQRQFAVCTVCTLLGRFVGVFVSVSAWLVLSEAPPACEQVKECMAEAAKKDGQI